MTKATFWERAASKIIDLLLISVVKWLLILVVVVLPEPNLTQLIGSLVLLLALFINFELFHLVYNTYLTSRFGGTVGKLILGLEVLDENGKRLNLGHSLYRHTAGYLVSGVCFFLGYFWTLRKERTAWHDLLTNSYVIKKVQNRGLTALVVIVTLIVIVILEAGATISLLVANPKLPGDFQGIAKEIESLNATPSPTLQFSPQDFSGLN